MLSCLKKVAAQSQARRALALIVSASDRHCKDDDSKKQYGKTSLSSD